MVALIGRRSLCQRAGARQMPGIAIDRRADAEARCPAAGWIGAPRGDDGERTMAPRLLAIAASLLIAGAVAAQTGPVEVTDAWARATPGKAENGGAYLARLSPAR